MGRQMVRLAAQRHASETSCARYLDHHRGQSRNWFRSGEGAGLAAAIVPRRYRIA